MIVVLLLILLMYKPLFWLSKKVILRSISAWNDMDKGLGIKTKPKKE